MIEKLRKINKAKLENMTNSEEEEKFQIIDKILADETCFKKMKTETAYKLLNDLGFELSEIKTIYNELIFNEK